MRLCLYQPDIPQNTGTLLRLAACMGMGVDIVEPCGFPFSDAKFRRAGMDYLDRLDIHRHTTWADFQKGHSGRLILLTTESAKPFTNIQYKEEDTLILGRESAGVPEDIHTAVDERVVIPMQQGMRSLNVALAGAMVVGEAARQLGKF